MDFKKSVETVPPKADNKTGKAGQWLNILAGFDILVLEFGKRNLKISRRQLACQPYLTTYIYKIVKT